MANTITNFIKFDQEDIQASKGEGLISTLDRDMMIEVVPFTSENAKAPTHQVYAKSPAGHQISVGGIWKNKNQWDADYFTLSIPHIGLKANLGRFAGQDDASLQAVIEWEVSGS